MANVVPTPTSLYFLQHDAPSLMPLYASDPDIFIVFPSSPDYTRVHFEYNTNITTIPLAIVFPANTDQLVTAVKHCSSQNPPIPMTVRGGGHDAHGRNILAGAVQLDLRLMNWTKVDAETKTVVVGPGCTAIDLQRVLAAHDRATVSGWVGSVGMTGWACGGGYGLEAGKWGLGVDNILGAKVVTAQGQLFDTDDDPELGWAIRGAGLGNFGVITELRLKTYPNPQLLAGFLAFPLSEASSVLGGFQRLIDNGALPENFSGEFIIAPMPEPAINFLVTWISEEHEDLGGGYAFLSKLKALGTVLLDTVTETTILKHHEAMNENPAFNPTGYTTQYSLAVSRLAGEAIQTLMKSAPPQESTSAILVHHAHGRAVQSESNAVWAHRDKHFILTFVGFDTPDSTLEAQARSRQWAEDSYRAVVDTGLALQTSYWSLARPEHCDSVRIFGRESVGRLQRLKRKYNPTNCFPAASPVLT